eukprot:CAMPEP_0176173290 /NCGR_PEP_ID=MMETSP0120_2-20121206/88786_1 /TAXON_ID=160619 /ORGANISM="Kryptoperidinium foliaceum, Strain CCMP 1326" /LENGTH=174 /DNA_ID=CAMNT_0017511305 /DNA_START=36 /DNA_END=557 /DNA_ORIENTATION=+
MARSRCNFSKARQSTVIGTGDGAAGAGAGATWHGDASVRRLVARLVRQLATARHDVAATVRDDAATILALLRHAHALPVRGARQVATGQLRDAPVKLPQGTLPPQPSSMKPHSAAGSVQLVMFGRHGGAGAGAGAGAGRRWRIGAIAALHDIPATVLLPTTIGPEPARGRRQPR